MAGRTRGKHTERTERAQRVVGARGEGRLQELFVGLRAWRAWHPTATLAAIALALELDRRRARVRAHMRADVALASAAPEVPGATPAVGPDGGGRWREEGVRRRTVGTLGPDPVTRERDEAPCAHTGHRIAPGTLQWGCGRTSASRHGSRTS